MADISKQSVSGDLEVLRNMAAGGGLTVSGKTELGGRVVVRDWLDAPNIVGAGKGIFPSYDDLYARYPRPTGGWWAVTDMFISDAGVLCGCVYVAVRGKWEMQTDYEVPLQINVPDVGISESIEALQDDVLGLRSVDDTLQANIDNEASTRLSADGTLQTNIDKKQDALMHYAENSAGLEYIPESGEEVEAGGSNAVLALGGDAGGGRVKLAGHSVFVETSEFSVDADGHTITRKADSKGGSIYLTTPNLIEQRATDITLDAMRRVDETNGGLEHAGMIHAYTTADDGFTHNGSRVLAERDIYNGLDQTGEGYALDARQGRALQTNIDNEASTRLSADGTLQANIDKKQDALELYAESGDAASVEAGSFTYNGSEVVTEEELSRHTLTEEEIDSIMECFMFRDVGVICKDELDCLLEGFEFVDLDGLVTRVEAEGDGLVELVAENTDSVATVRGKTTIGCVDEEDVERMFDEVSKE